MPTLRTTIADYLARVRGVRTTPDRIVICTGFQHALHLLAATLHRAGKETMAVESYGFALHREIVRAAGLRTRGLAVDPQGACLEELAEVDAALLTPAHQFPLVSPSPPNAALAFSTGPATPAVWSSRMTMTASSATTACRSGISHPVPTTWRTSAPPARAWHRGYGWPGWSFRRACSTPCSRPNASPALTRARSTNWPSTGSSAVAHTTGTSAAAGCTTGAAATGSSPCWKNTARPTTVTGIAAGLHAVVTLPDLDAAEETAVVAARAERAGLAIHGLSRYREIAADEAHVVLVIGFATPPEHAFPAALHALQRTLSTM